MAAPDKVIWYLSNTGSHVLAEQTWMAARETLAIQLFQQTHADNQLATWVIQSEKRRDQFRLMAQRAMYGEAY